MIIFLSKDKVKLMDFLIKTYGENNGGYLKEQNVMMRAIWNIFTNNNGERKRSLKIMIHNCMKYMKVKKDKIKTS